MDEEIEDELAAPLSTLLFNGEGNAPSGLSGKCTVSLFDRRPCHDPTLTATSFFLAPDVEELLTVWSPSPLFDPGLTAPGAMRSALLGSHSLPGERSPAHSHAPPLPLLRVPHSRGIREQQRPSSSAS